jgi:hypothetical protein
MDRNTFRLRLIFAPCDSFPGLQMTGQDLDGDGKIGGKKGYGVMHGMNPAMMGMGAGMGAAGMYGAGGGPPVINALEQVQFFFSSLFP